MTRTLAVPLLAGLVALAGALASTLALDRAARRAVDDTLAARLAAAGQTASLALDAATPSAARLRAIMEANRLDGAFVVDRDLRVIADATGPAGRRVDLLRVDPRRIERALAGDSGVGDGYALGDLAVDSGVFPLRDARGAVVAALVLEAGQAFAAPRRDVARATSAGVALSVAVAVALVVLGAGYARAERLRRDDAARAARADAMQRMAAIAAHEIRNPLGVIRGTVELMQARHAASAGVPARDASALDDVLAEVERLRRLTEDLLDLAADRPLERARVDLGAILVEAQRACEREHPAVTVALAASELPAVEGDPGRLRQVFGNLLANAAEAQREGTIALSASAAGGVVRVLVRDCGPGVPAGMRDRLFDPFATTKEGGTGLGLALSRRIVERHGGAIEHVDDGRAGAAFEVRLPAAPAGEGAA